MTSVTESGSPSRSRAGKISISSCLKCKKVISLVDQLTKNMHEFEIVTMEMQFDVKSAKSKSEKVLSNFWQLISMIKSITIADDKEETGNDLSENPTSSKLIVSVEKQGNERQNKSADETEIEPFKSKSKAVEKNRRRPNLKQKLKSTPNPNMTAKRSIELQRVKRLLRTIKCETPKGFYKLFECTKCQKQFNKEGNARRHVKVRHLCLGTSCPNCGQRCFDKNSLELHTEKCNQTKQFQQIKVWLKNDREKPVKVQLQPHQKQAEEKSSTRNQSSSRKIQNQSVEKNKRNPVFDLTRLKVRNPYPNFSIVKAMNVKVVIQRLEMKKSGEITSISQTKVQTMEKIEMKTGKQTSCSEEVENESAVPVLSCDEV